MSRTGRVAVYLTEEERAALRRRARGRGLSAFLRFLALGSHPNAERDADDWWNNLTPGRKEQVHLYISSQRAGRPSVHGEVELPLG